MKTRQRKLFLRFLQFSLALYTLLITTGHFQMILDRSLESFFHVTKSHHLTHTTDKSKTSQSSEILGEEIEIPNENSEGETVSDNESEISVETSKAILNQALLVFYHFVYQSIKTKRFDNLSLKNRQVVPYYDLYCNWKSYLS